MARRKCKEVVMGMQPGLGSTAAWCSRSAKDHVRDRVPVTRLREQAAARKGRCSRSLRTARSCLRAAFTTEVSPAKRT